MTDEELAAKAQQLRREAIEMLFTAQSGHPGSALSIMDMLTVLYFDGVLQHDPEQPSSDDRDYFLLSNGHAVPALYAVLADRGYFDVAELSRLRQLHAGAQGHPHRGSLPGIEISTGSLGQGLSVGVGLAYGVRQQGKQNRVFVMMSDGEQEEGSTWEAVMYAPKKQLNNLVAIVDKNQMQIDGATAEIMPGLDPLADKYRAFNWEVIEIDGHDLGQIREALATAIAAQSPTVIIAETVRGKGVSYMEGSEHWHAGAISQEQYETAITELGGHTNG